MWWKWLPWRYLLRRAARAHGFLDPLTVAARLRRFAQPSEVAEPIELLRAGVVFHARGLINSRVIQHNRDWVWPFWAERQFDPRDPAFIPRAFSITHVNLSHRNWTAVGLPDVDSLPIVDPRGLVTPFWDGWSLDAWVIADDGRRLLPSRAGHVEQTLELDDLRVVTQLAAPDLALITRVEARQQRGEMLCRLEAKGEAAAGGWLVLALRPYNPEGISFIHEVRLDEARRAWWVDGRRVSFAEPVERHHGSTYRAGDVLIHLADGSDEAGAVCDVGMATAAAAFRLEAGRPRGVALEVPLGTGSNGITASWPEALTGRCLLELPDQACATLYEQALRTLVLHTPSDVYAGPYTYKRFWFRDAAFILHALLCAGLFDRVERVIDRFPERQARDGFFRSQEGEWDANGEVLWLIERHCALSGRPPKEAWRRAIEKGARWLGNKRLPEDGSPHAGLLPAGFSAEHLGPSDYYYWDDFWGIAGLEASASLMRRYGDWQRAADFAAAAKALRGAVERSLDHVQRRLAAPGMPASPYRRMDSGAVGCLAAGYPLQLLPSDDPRLLGTAGFLLDTCLHHGALFHDVTHSGINPYLTLHLAQVLLRARDPRHADLARAVVRLASPTGQWPEAIHPWTGGGCMGDGQHAWAAAEWMMMMRNAFVREEDERLVVAAGLWPEWLEDGAVLRLGPAPTAFGTVDLTIEVGADAVRVTWSGAWRDAPPPVEVALFGQPPQRLDGAQGQAEVKRATCASS